MSAATKEFLEWSSSLKPWQQDVLRRIVIKGFLSPQDEEEVIKILKSEHGIPCSDPLPQPAPLEQRHMPASATQATLHLLGISNIQNANRIAPGSKLEFNSDGLTVVYGGNGSGKSGYTRILRNACRSRISSVNGKRNAILPNVYAPLSDARATANLHILINGTEKIVEWHDQSTSIDELAQIAVFDSEAAAIYVDDSNHIAFLPFNIDLFFKLNIVCASIRKRLEKEHEELKATLSEITDEIDANTLSAQFLISLSAKTTKAEIDAALCWLDRDEARFQELEKLLQSSPPTIAEVEGLTKWIDNVASRMKALEQQVSDEAVAALRELHARALEARRAATDVAAGAFSGEPLPGIGGETWRRMFVAASEYASEVGAPATFSALAPDSVCPLCQQALEENARKRITRFQDYVSGHLSHVAEQADSAYNAAYKSLCEAALHPSADFDARLKQLELRSAGLAVLVRDWLNAYRNRHAHLISGEIGSDIFAIPPMPHQTAHESLASLAEALRKERDTLTDLAGGANSESLKKEHKNLQAKKKISVLRKAVDKRVADLKLEAALKRCVDATATNAITRKSGEFNTKYLTPRVRELLSEEIDALQLKHFRPTLERKTDRFGAQYRIDLGTQQDCRASQVLSEGEQRAIALAAFLAEVRAISDTDPIVIDDPVSSLDIDRSLRVAERLAKEAKSRQVVVFTHSLVFYHQLLLSASELQVKSQCVSIFRDIDITGLVDPAGAPWEGLTVAKRVNILKDKLQSVKKLASSSPSDYRIEVKSLYGRMRDCWERVVEEKLFHSVVTRFANPIQTRSLRYVDVTDDLYIQIEAGMTRTSTYSHDNPASETALTPTPEEVSGDIEALINVISAIEVSNKAAEARRKKISIPSSPAAHLLAPQLASNENSIQLESK